MNELLLALILTGAITVRGCGPEKSSLKFEAGKCYYYEKGHFQKNSQLIKVLRIEGDAIQYVFYDKELGYLNFPQESSVKYGSVTVFTNEVKCP